jgi:hypothetical protein
MNNKYWLLSISLALLALSLACTLTNPAPAKAPKPTATPIPGWELFTGQGVEMWLPESFEGGDLSSEDMDTIIETLKNLGPEYNQIVRMIEQNPNAFILWVFDSQIGSSGFLTNINVVKEKVMSSMTIDTYLDLVEKQLPPSFKIIERSKVQLDTYEAGRVFIDLDLPTGKAKEVIFLIKDQNYMYAITYATSADEFTKRLSVFEQSVNTFSVKP